MSASLDSLRTGCRTGEYYAPLQTYKTLINRKVSGPRRNFEEAVGLIHDGIVAAVGGLCAPVVIDLAEELGNILESFGKPFDKHSLAEIKKLWASLSIPQPTEEWQLASSQVLEVLYQWAGHAPRSDELGPEDREWFDVTIADVNLQIARRTVAEPGAQQTLRHRSTALTKAISHSLKTITNPFLLASVLSAACLNAYTAERSDVVSAFLAALLRQIELRPHAASRILHTARNVIFPCAAVSDALKKLMRVVFRVLDASCDNDLKVAALKEVWASPCAVTSLSPAAIQRLSDACRKVALAS